MQFYTQWQKYNASRAIDPVSSQSGIPHIHTPKYVPPLYRDFRLCGLTDVGKRGRKKKGKTPRIITNTDNHDPWRSLDFLHTALLNVWMLPLLSSSSTCMLASYCRAMKLRISMATSESSG